MFHWLCFPHTMLIRPFGINIPLAPFQGGGKLSSSASSAQKHVEEDDAVKHRLIEEFGAIRTMSNEQGDVMFVAKDVCDALKHSNSRKAVADMVDKDDVTRSYIVDSLGRKNHAIFINESGLYALILSSKLESARRFKHWVTSEVLPSIRKQGGYMVARPDETDEEVLARALQIMQAAVQSRLPTNSTPRRCTNC